jgi:hypothetical protein
MSAGLEVLTALVFLSWLPIFYGVPLSVLAQLVRRKHGDPVDDALLTACWFGFVLCILSLALFRVGVPFLFRQAVDPGLWRGVLLVVCGLVLAASCGVGYLVGRELANRGRAVAVATGLVVLLFMVATLVTANTFPVCSANIPIFFEWRCD